MTGTNSKCRITQGATFISFDKALSKGAHLIRSKENPNLGLLIICGCNLGLRISDLLTLTFDQLKQDNINIVEKKTGKQRVIQVNDHIKRALASFEGCRAYDKGGQPFQSQKGTTYSVQHVNRLMKKHFRGQRISTHSLRKTFGRRVWDNNGRNDEALLYLSEIFNHSNTAITRRYLGIRQDEIKDIYINL